MRAEFFEYGNALEYHDEFQLTSGAVKIDLLIIKLKRALQIKKSIGQIFRQSNVIEYKSPNVSVSIFDYYKLRAYASFYAERERTRMSDMSMTLVVTYRKRSLLNDLNTEFEVNNAAPGIYYVSGETCPTQIIVSSELPRDDCRWLYSLRSDVGMDDVESMMTQGIAVYSEKVKLDAYKDAFIQANFNTLEELKTKMGHKFIDLIRDEVAKTKAESVLSFLKFRFKKVPRNIEKAVLSYTDLTALESLIQCAAVCGSIEEFSESLVHG
jgi:hypothetical protein